MRIRHEREVQERLEEARVQLLYSLTVPREIQVKVNTRMRVLHHRSCDRGPSGSRKRMLLSDALAGSYSPCTWCARMIDAEMK